MSPDLFFADLETVIYGCHARSRRRISDIFGAAGLYTFSFAEYFLDEPLARPSQGDNNSCESLKRVIRERKLYLPFLPWAASQLQYRIETYRSGSGNVSLQLKSKTRDWKQDLRSRCSHGISLSKWDSQVTRIHDFLCSKRWEPSKIKSKTGILNLYSEAEALAGNGGPNQEDIGNGVALTSYEVLVHPWAKSDVSPKAPVVVLRHPIASAGCYYGHFALVFQSIQANGGSKLVEELTSELGALATQDYSPTLALLHLSKWERKLAGACEADRSGEKRVEECLANGHVSPLSLEWVKSGDEIERAFGQLWEWRKSAYEQNPVTSLGSIKQSIILDKYHIASPRMIREVRSVVRGAQLMKLPGSERDSLPCALVYGEAGSGKEQMARLIGSLNKELWNVAPRTQNMAAVKPGVLAIPILFGFKYQGNVLLDGFFQPDRGQSGPPSSAPQLGSVSTGGSGGACPQRKDAEAGDASQTLPRTQVLILDELNSLDYDMQGSLLRVLENNEAPAMFESGSGSHSVNAMVVGVVNEDPDSVTLEQEMQLLENAVDFLGRSERARLYDALTKARRLRPDLVYRLKRGMYVRLPPLRERREDIPLLFRQPCEKAVRALAGIAGGVSPSKALQFQCELEAYDELMRPDLPWPGNIRQLQAVATRVAAVVWDRVLGENREENGKGKSVFVEVPDIKVVLSEHFPGVYSHEQAKRS